MKRTRTKSAYNIGTTKPFLTTEEVAEVLGFNPQTLVNWRYKRKGPLYVVLEGKTIRYRRTDLKKWLDRQPVIKPMT